MDWNHFVTRKEQKDVSIYFAEALDKIARSRQRKGVIFVPRGKYVIKRTIKVPGNIEVDFVGEGTKCSILYFASQDGSTVIDPCFLLERKHRGRTDDMGRVSFQDLAIDPMGLASTTLTFDDKGSCDSPSLSL